MRDLLATIERWRAEGQRVALARVVATEGSSPRGPGAAMAVSERGEVAGSVSGGCVEGAVVAESRELLSSVDGSTLGTPARRFVASPRLKSFGYSDEDAFAVGLTCGGTVHLLIEELRFDDADPSGALGGPDGYRALRDALLAEEPVCVATVIASAPAETALRRSAPPPPLGAALVVREGSGVVGRLGGDDLDRVVRRDALGALQFGTTGSRHYGPCGEARQEEVTVLFEAYAPPPRLVIFGAVDFTASLVRVAKVLGYRVVVCDARRVFATVARFPDADEVVVDWPDRYLARVGAELGPRDGICVLTHDPKFDVPAVAAALATEVGYLGAMGSRRTHEDRLRRLLEAGVSETDLDQRLMSPIGLDLGASTPEETAIAICAEIVAVRHHRAAPSLRDGSGPIHRARATG